MEVTCKLGEKGCWDDGKCRATSYCENKVITNADRIRAMSDEVLARFLAENEWECETYSDCAECPRMTDYGCVLLSKWLKQPADMRGEEDG